MQKILILGSPGSGKSTLARQLSAITSIEVTHMDKLYWKPGWIATEQSEFHQMVMRLTEKESWIIDGNYSGTLECRIKAADTIIFLDLPRSLCLWSVVKRTFLNFGRNRKDVAEACPERLDKEYWLFLNYVWNFKAKKTPRLMHLLFRQHQEKNIFLFKNRREAKSFLNKIQTFYIKR